MGTWSDKTTSYGCPGVRAGRLVRAKGVACSLVTLQFHTPNMSSSTHPYCIHNSVCHPSGTRCNTVTPAPTEIANKAGSMVVKAATWRIVGRIRRGMLNMNKPILIKDMITSTIQVSPSRTSPSNRASGVAGLVVVWSI
jgi:hypothetical protein